ncbi:DUF5681 domain-containing protein [Burkholderia vietnamiensis]|uniref:DUF5681 domain-containing protein n=1 Tax=Burkholderia vietnamiensis TaxID=60552 RepID=UPI002653131D|nr:DUF5681 domain-containing protein [Burkholderia vietnamiensis]MDN7555553.1 DUF5681 domain-containing protein [Burkholderia vietnamiensis]HDR9095088.1 hypothetical protein [Burkholderia vietnamiensis]
MTQFRKGQSGNPAGKPKGTRDKRTALRELLQPHAADLVAKAVELAKAGDTTALRICIDRCIPAIKAKDQPISLSGLSGSPAEMGKTVLQAMATGDITPNEAAAVMQVVTAQMRIVEVDDLLKRIEALEGNGDGEQQQS